MFAGHIGAALAIGRVERRLQIGVVVAAALLLDIALWTFVLLGWESVLIPADFADTHRPEFNFPYSHSLLAGVGWSAMAAVIGLFAYRRASGRQRMTLLLGAAVFSHWLLDSLVHVPGLPLTGTGSPELGGGLWQYLPLALAVETGILIAGLSLFIPVSGLSRLRSLALTLLCLASAGFTVLGMTVAPLPPSAQAMAAGSLVTLIVVCTLVWWLGRTPYPGQT